MKLEPWQHHHTLLDSVLHPGESLQFRISSVEAKSTRKSQEHIIPSPQANVVHFSSEPIQIPQPAVRRRLLFGQSSYGEPSLDSGVFSPSSWRPEMQQIIPEDDDFFKQSLEAMKVLCLSLTKHQHHITIFFTGHYPGPTRWSKGTTHI